MWRKHVFNSRKAPYGTAYGKTARAAPHPQDAKSQSRARAEPDRISVQIT
jgi:hypothetical protein